MKWSGQVWHTSHWWGWDTGWQKIRVQWVQFEGKVLFVTNLRAERQEQIFQERSSYGTCNGSVFPHNSGWFTRWSRFITGLLPCISESNMCHNQIQPDCGLQLHFIFISATARDIARLWRWMDTVSAPLNPWTPTYCWNAGFPGSKGHLQTWCLAMMMKVVQNVKKMRNKSNKVVGNVAL